MIKLSNVGYQERTIEAREITVGELRHRMAKRYLNNPEAKFIILCLTDGERLELNSMEDCLGFEWADDCKIEIINLPHTWGFEGEKNPPTIITMQIAAAETECETIL